MQPCFRRLDRGTQLRTPRMSWRLLQQSTAADLVALRRCIRISTRPRQPFRVVARAQLMARVPRYSDTAARGGVRRDSYASDTTHLPPNIGASPERPQTKRYAAATAAAAPAAAAQSQPVSHGRRRGDSSARCGAFWIQFTDGGVPYRCV